MMLEYSKKENSKRKKKTQNKRFYSESVSKKAHNQC